MAFTHLRSIDEPTRVFAHIVKPKQFAACARPFSCKNAIPAPSVLCLRNASNVHDAPKGPAVCVDRAKAVYRRRDFAQEENAAVRGHGVLGAARRRTGSLYGGATGFPHLLLLEEEQAVLHSVPLNPSPKTSFSCLPPFPHHCSLSATIVWILVCLLGWSISTLVW